MMSDDEFAKAYIAALDAGDLNGLPALFAQEHGR
jgi:hypothetical protein